jgi:hypothetical protein
MTWRQKILFCINILLVFVGFLIVSCAPLRINDRSALT